MNLSKHVTLEEFERSDAAVRHGISNKMNEFETQRAKLLCEKVFEPIREYLGRPLKINSDRKSTRLNPSHT